MSIQDWNADIEYDSDITAIWLSAIWCSPCRMIKPILEKISESPEIAIYKVDIEEHPEFAAQLEVTSVPTLLIYKKAVLIERIIGAKPKRVLEQAFDI